MPDSIAHAIPTTLMTESGENLPFVDTFQNELAAGSVVGSITAQGIVRKGKDTEGVIGIDHGALRIQPLVRPKWGKSGIAYGPYARQNGLAFGVFLINGHNISQAQALPERMSTRLQRWILGSETERRRVRLLRWIRSRQKRFFWRMLLHWIVSSTRFLRPSPLTENLAVGWFPSAVPTNPCREGNSLVVHAFRSEGGELWARMGTASLRTARGVQNIQMYYVVVLREQGAAYYAASIPGVPGMDAYPRMQLLAIDPSNDDKTVYAGIHQSALGEIGFRVDTRVYRTQVATMPEFSKWYGSAQGADTLIGEGSLHLSNAAVGGRWTVHEGAFSRTAEGLATEEAENAAMLELSSPSGLIHVVIKTREKPVQRVGIVWRCKDEGNFWCFEVGSRQCQLSIKENGLWNRFPATRDALVMPNELNSVQVFDDGDHIRLYLNGDLVYGTELCDSRHRDATNVGIRVAGKGDAALLRSFEAHPRSIPVPECFELGEPWWVRGEKVVVEDHFGGGSGDLAGRITSSGARTWRQELGSGVIELTGTGAAKVLGTVEKPCPGRTAYTISWDNSRFADVGVRITPPGACGQPGHKGRGGLIFWQDARNYLTISLWNDESGIFSVSSFFCWDGYEELYDAVWTNVGKRVRLGIPYDFRVVCDGKRYLASINGEPVLYRAFSDVYPDWHELLIHRVGIVANWEWGTDTGSTFQDFAAKDLA